jgi:hypothetical protein
MPALGIVRRRQPKRLTTRQLTRPPLTIEPIHGRFTHWLAGGRGDAALFRAGTSISRRGRRCAHTGCRWHRHRRRRQHRAHADAGERGPPREDRSTCNVVPARVLAVRRDSHATASAPLTVRSHPKAGARAVRVVPGRVLGRRECPGNGRATTGNAMSRRIAPLLARGIRSSASHGTNDIDRSDNLVRVLNHVGLFVMRRGVMVVDDLRRPLDHDLKQLPRLAVEFALVLPRRLASLTGSLKGTTTPRTRC